MSLELSQVKKIIEGAIMAAGESLSIHSIGKIFDEEERPDNATIKSVLEELMEDYAERGVELKEVGTGYRFQAHVDLAPWLGRLWEEKPPRFSRAFLETLSIIAYRQPVTRAEIEEIRGVVVSSGITKVLIERGWVRVVGHRDVPGKPALLATTKEFLDYFNLKGLGDLPSLAELQDIEKMAENLQQQDIDAMEDSQSELALTEDGTTEDEDMPEDDVMKLVDDAAINEEVLDELTEELLDEAELELIGEDNLEDALEDAEVIPGTDLDETFGEELLGLEDDEFAPLKTLEEDNLE